MNIWRTNLPDMAKIMRSMKPVIMAILKALALLPESMLLVNPMKIGMFPNGSTTMKREIVALRRFRRNSCSIFVKILHLNLL